MATISIGQPPTGEDLTLQKAKSLHKLNFLVTLRPKLLMAKPIPMEPITFLHGYSRVIWEDGEVEQMIIKENMEFVVIGKLIPKQCELKVECNIKLLSNMHILIRASCLEDYFNLLSKPTYYILHMGWAYLMRNLKWNLVFNQEGETSTTIE
ncbi:hypothetical protein H5410_027030 [Solanum commersonii]|uniref:DUF4283 domain-containing protein n=1 Tax=Solanum commersonii TaxID=4109 RepID=A0A9J5YYP9_SOLCO|nr:hypothetical protein H5410_027030 [Solanum commersonii]